MDVWTLFVESTVSGDCNPGAGQSTGAKGDLTPTPPLFNVIVVHNLQASLELEIDSLVEQSTDLHSLYARQDELLKRLTFHIHCSQCIHYGISNLVNKDIWRRIWFCGGEPA